MVNKTSGWFCCFQGEALQSDMPVEYEYFSIGIVPRKVLLFSFGRFLSLGFSKNFRENFHPWEIIISLQDTKQIFFNIYVCHLLYPRTSRWTLWWYLPGPRSVMCVSAAWRGPAPGNWGNLKCEILTRTPPSHNFFLVLEENSAPLIPGLARVSFVSCFRSLLNRPSSLLCRVCKYRCWYSHVSCDRDFRSLEAPAREQWWLLAVARRSGGGGGGGAVTNSVTCWLEPWPGSVSSSVELQMIHRFSHSWRRPLLEPSPGWKRLLALSHWRHY